MIITIIIIASVLLLIITYFYSFSKGIKSGAMQAEQSFVSIIDQANPNALNIFHEYLEANFLKYLHKRLVGYESGAMPITTFIEEMTVREKASAFVTGFTILIQSQISNELKKIFFRYYNFEERDAGGKTSRDTYQTTIFDKYLIEWSTLRIRKVTAEFVTALGSSNLSQQHAIQTNAQLFTLLEIKIYQYLGMVDLSSDITKPPKSIPKLT